MRIKQILIFWKIKGIYNITIKNIEEILYDYPLKIRFE